MISGDSPVTPVLTIRASGVMPRSCALWSLMITSAAAPSFSGQALAAVTRPSGRNTGFSPETPSKVTPGRGPSSALTTVPSGSVTRVISRSQKPSAMACSARFWLRTPNSSMSRRETSFSSARFSAVWPMAMYASGSAPSSRGSCQESAPLSAALATAAWAASKRGFWVSGCESELPLTNRDTISTPAEMTTSPSPALIACIAIREVCSDEEQYRVIVVPGRWSMPSRTATIRPMLKPCSPPGRPQPSIRSSMSVGSSSGTWSRAARTIVAVRSSGRSSFRAPLNARPIGERVAATMTAPGRGSSTMRARRRRRTTDRARTSPRVAGASPPCGESGPGAGPSRLVGLAGGGDLRRTTPAESRPRPPRPGLLTADLGGLHLCAGPAGGPGGGLGHRAHGVAAHPEPPVGRGRPDGDAVGDGRQHDRGRRGVAVRGRVELVDADQGAVDREGGAEDRAQRDGAPALRHDGDGLRGREVAAPPPGHLPQRLGERPDRAEVRAVADDDLAAGADQRPDRLGQMPHGGRRPGAAGDVVGADHDHYHVGWRGQRPPHRAGESLGPRPGDREPDQPDRTLGELGQRRGDQDP